MRPASVTMALVLSLATAGCAGMSEKEQRMLSGGAAGAAGGAALGAVTGGSAAVGALVGGAVGTGGGYLYDEYETDDHD